MHLDEETALRFGPESQQRRARRAKLGRRRPTRLLARARGRPWAPAFPPPLGEGEGGAGRGSRGTPGGQSSAPPAPTPTLPRRAGEGAHRRGERGTPRIAARMCASFRHTIPPPSVIVPKTETPCPPLSRLLVVPLEQAVARRCAPAARRCRRARDQIERPEGDFARGYDRLARPLGLTRRE